MTDYSEYQSWAIHWNKECFGEDAHEFKPEKWLDPKSAFKERCYMAVSVRSAAPLSCIFIFIFVRFFRCIVFADSFSIPTV